MTRLSEILALPDAERQSFYRAIDVDVESFTPPEGLKGAALTLKLGETGDIDETLIDIIIAYNMAGVEVTVEVPAAMQEVDASYLMAVAATAGFTIALLPPEADGDEAYEAYTQRLEAFTDAYFRQSNFGRYLFPVTNYLEYMFVEVLAKADAMDPQDPYIRALYIDAVSEARSEAFKARIKARVHQIMGGADGFETFVRAFALKIYKQTESNLKDLLEQRRAERAGETPRDPAAQAEEDGEDCDDDADQASGGQAAGVGDPGKTLH